MNTNKGNTIKIIFIASKICKSHKMVKKITTTFFLKNHLLNKIVVHFMVKRLKPK